MEPLSLARVALPLVLIVFAGVLIGLAVLQVSDDVSVAMAVATICVSGLSFTPKRRS